MMGQMGQKIPPVEDPSGRWSCCKKGDDDPIDHIPNGPGASMMESLRYMPVRFDEGSTIDVERSQARYSKIVVHSTRARTQRRSKAWEDWLRSATAGRGVVMLYGFGNGDLDQLNDDTNISLAKRKAMYQLDRDLSKLSFLPQDGSSDSGVTLLVDNIQVICPAKDFALFFDQVESSLAECERSRAIVLQYMTDDSVRKRVCFLEETEQHKDRFVQALTALWLEKRNEHSMWF